MSEEEQEQTATIEAENTEETAGAEPEGANEEAEQQPTEQPALEEEPGGFQKRINKITADKHEYRRRAEAAEAKLKESFQQPAPAAGEVPSLEQFDYDEEKYQDALIAYKVDQRLGAAQREKEQRRQQERQRKAADDFAKKVAAAKVPADYSEKIYALDASVPLQSDVIEAIQHLRNGPNVAYYLAENLDVADTIYRLPRSARTAEIGIISAQLSAGRKTIKPASKAPNPVNPVKSGVSSAKNIREMSMEEIMADPNI